MSNDNRQHPDDAILSALIDGELPSEQAARLRVRLGEEPALAARYQALRQADRKVRNVFASVDMGPMPERVLRLLQDSDARDAGAGGSSESGKVVSLQLPRRFYRPPLALAAGIALFFLGFALAQVLLPRATPAPELALADAAGVVKADSPLHRALQDLPSGKTVRLADELAVTPRMTFKRVDDGYCRLVDVAGASGVTSSLACRANGGWRLQLATFAEKAPAPPGDGYRLASDGGPTAIDRAIDHMIEGAPLGSDEEAELLQSGW